MNRLWVLGSMRNCLLDIHMSLFRWWGRVIVLSHEENDRKRKRWVHWDEHVPNHRTIVTTLDYAFCNNCAIGITMLNSCRK